MLQWTSLLLILASVVAAEESTTREVPYPTVNVCSKRGCPTNHFDKGYLFSLNDVPGMPPNGYGLWGPDGGMRYHVDLLAPDGTPARVNDVGIDSDGTAVATMWFGGYPRKGRVDGRGLIFVDPSGRQTQFIPTDRWIPDHATFGPDHAIWVSGTQYIPLQRTSYHLVRKYSRDGKLIGEFLPRFSPEPSAIYGWIKAAADRIGFMTYPGHDLNDPVWMELDLTGNVIGQWKLGPDHSSDFYRTNVAFTADGRLFSMFQDKITHKYQIMIFDRTTSTWQPTAAAVIPPAAHLAGADENDLLFESRQGIETLIRVPASRQ